MDLLSASSTTFLHPVIAGGTCTPPPAKSTEQWLLSTLKYPKTLAQLKGLHAQVVKTGHSHDDLVLGQLLLCCSTSRSMGYALSVFLSIPSPKPFFYNAMLKGYAHGGAHDECLDIYSLMRSRSVPCDSFTFPVVLRSATSLGLVGVGEEVHGVTVKMGFAREVIVQTAVMDMYSSCGLAERARVIFDRMDERDAICWNTMIAGYVKCGEYDRACDLFDRMPEKNISSWNTILDMYCKVGNMCMATHLFDSMPERDVISWNAMISGYAKAGDPDAARRLFEEMQTSVVKPNEVTVVAVLAACAHLGALDLGHLVDAQRVFDGAGGRDTFLCSTMIEVLAMHGKAEEAFQLFDFMRKEAIGPNDVTFVGLLKACSHAGLVEAGQSYFDMMNTVFGMKPKVEHYGFVWASLLSSCRIHGDVKLAEKVAWEDAAMIRKTMKKKGIVKKPGCSLIEDVDSDRKEQALLHHSEKLALAFGLNQHKKKNPEHEMRILTHNCYWLELAEIGILVISTHTCLPRIGHLHEEHNLNHV
ncbi:hypothetical protein Taro_043472 [Colocasia esculenta]|uniref:Chlororespiratory reduction 4 n=1 Tax=Colocasia esculenta TaxID=4460 RepID=A0A843WRI5_COLES|nr:hypothetical protein [Colocasia esculenta]